MLEKMDDFFTARVDGYDELMKRNIVGATRVINILQHSYLSRKRLTVYKGI